MAAATLLAIGVGGEVCVSGSFFLLLLFLMLCGCCVVVVAVEYLMFDAHEKICVIFL